MTPAISRAIRIHRLKKTIPIATSPKHAACVVQCRDLHPKYRKPKP